MIKFLKKFWQDDSGDGYISPILKIIFSLAAASVVLTSLFIGLKNMAIKESQQIQSINP